MLLNECIASCFLQQEHDLTTGYGSFLIFYLFVVSGGGGRRSSWGWVSRRLLARKMLLGIYTGNYRVAIIAGKTGKMGTFLTNIWKTDIYMPFLIPSAGKIGQKPSSIKH